MTPLPVADCGPRTRREKRTIQAMLTIFCRARHGRSAGLCAECRELGDYALRRLDCCCFGEEKPTCAACPIHCYKADMRNRVRAVMAFAGPRMLLLHPILAIRHQWHSLWHRHARKLISSGRSNRPPAVKENQDG